MRQTYQALLPAHLLTPRFLRYWSKYLNWAAQCGLWMDYGTVQRNVRFLARGDVERAILVLMATMDGVVPRPKTAPPLAWPREEENCSVSGPLYPLTVDGERWSVSRHILEQYRRDGVPLGWSPTARTFYIRP